MATKAANDTAAAPMWGSLADVLRRHWLMLIIGIGGLSACVLGIALARSLAMLIPLIMLYMFFGSPIGPPLDNTRLNILGTNHHLYGRQRGDDHRSPPGGGAIVANHRPLMSACTSSQVGMPCRPPSLLTLRAAVALATRTASPRGRPRATHRA